ncbi:MAG TPA: hypothetical protein VFI16_02960 [Anaeromyxobacteraceae bacterium]|nr:hypothetical protein [Anaeromyxobacteraceae bacterium]
MTFANTGSHPKGYARIAAAGALALAVLAAGCSSHPADATSPTLTRAELRAGMRKLWEEHVQWTRMVIVSFAAGLPDFDAAVGRLLRNQDDIGNAVKPFYGEEAGLRLAALLKDHILIAADVLQAARAGDASALETASGRWYANGDEIADFLAAANPIHWPREGMRAAMREHLDTTLAEAAARLGGSWDQDIASYEAARQHVLMMADTLADGIAAQFPELFADGAAPSHSH